MTPFNLIQSLRSWFFARDGDIVLQDGRAIKISNADITITTGGIVITGGTVTIGGAAVSVAGHVHTHASTTSQTTDDHHAQAHVLATGTALGPDHTISGAADGEVLRASSSMAARFDQLAHADLGSVTADQHHNESHSIASHSDTSGTGSELNTLTDGSDAGALHVHDAAYHLKTTFSENPGTTSKPLKTDTGGLLRTAGLAAGVAPAANRIHAVGEVRAGGLVCGATNVSSGTGRLMLAEISTPGTPASGYVYIWAATSGRVYSKDDTGTVRELSNV